MSGAYQGLPRTAWNYWRFYGNTLLAFTAMIVTAGSIGALVVSMSLPEAGIFYLIAIVSAILHWSAMYLKDVWTGRYDPDQSTWTSSREMWAVLVLAGAFVSGLMLISTALGYSLMRYSNSGYLVSMGVSAYYPVVDFGLIRRGRKTPGALLIIIAIYFIGAVSDIRDSLTDLWPLVAGRDQGMFNHRKLLR